MSALIKMQAMLDVSELDRFGKLTGRFQKVVLREAGTAASRVIRDAIIPLVPIESQSLKRSMSVKTKTYSSGTVICSVGPRADYTAWVIDGKRTSSFFKIVTNKRAIKRRPSKYAHLVHDGTKPHTIITRFGSMVYGKRPRRNFIIVNHPGSQPHPFIARGYSSSESRAVSVWSSTAATAITREFSK